MRYLAIAAVAFAAMSATASAEPMKLTERQMDQVSAGLLDNLRLSAQIAAAIQASAPITTNTVAAVGILAENTTGAGQTDVKSLNTANFFQWSFLGND